MKLSTSGMGQQAHEGEKKCLNSELWHACAGPLVSLPIIGSRVVYFPQGHSEQVAATTNKEIDSHIPNYPGLPPQLICQLHNLTMHAEVETDEVCAQMTLQPLTSEEQKESYLPVELGTPSRQPTNYFCKTLTASDTSTHGGFSVPRRAAEKVFPPLDFSQTPPAQELIARDLHDVEWKFRHIFRGQPKRHLLTTGWSVFVSAKRLVAGDSVLFIWNEKNQLLLGIRRATRPQTVMSSSVLSSDSMHIGLLAAAAQAATTNSCFTIFYHPRASPTEFVIHLSKYVKAVYHTRVSVGMRFRMLFETEESSVRRYMGTITGIGDLDPARWPNSHWRSIKVGWDESTASERQPRVSLWEIEPLTTFPMYPSLFPSRLKRPWYPGSSSFQDGCNEAVNFGDPRQNSMNFSSVGGMFPWMQQRVDPTLLRTDFNQQYQAVLAQNFGNGDSMKQQSLQFQQQPQIQYLQQSAGNIHNPLLQQQEHAMHRSISLNMLPEQSQMPNFPNPSLPSPSFSKSEFNNSVPSGMQNMLGSLSTEGSSSNNILNFSKVTQFMLNESPVQQWMSKFPQAQVNTCSDSLSLSQYPRKDVHIEQEPCVLDAQNQALFSPNIDSSALLLPTTISSIGTCSVDASMPLVDSGFPNSLYSYGHDSSELLHGAGHDSPTQTGTFVKVCKSGSVGRSLDITRFSSYKELREEVGQMFGIEGLLEDPKRSGWQLVFVDRENDVLLLGDDPWDSFVNNVWYIKILSPEDVQKLGRQEIESLSRDSAEKMNRSNGGDRRDLITGFPPLGSLEF